MNLLVKKLDSRFYRLVQNHLNDNQPLKEYAKDLLEGEEVV